MFHSMGVSPLLGYVYIMFRFVSSSSVVVGLVCLYLTAVSYSLFFLYCVITVWFLLADRHEVHGRRNRFFGAANEELFYYYVQKRNKRCMYECMYTVVDSV